MRNFLFSIFVGGFCLFISACSSTSSMTPSFLESAQSNDTTLTTAVRSAFDQTNEPMLSRVHIESQAGKVILSGYVKKIRQSDIAEQIASRVPGVQTVENNIIVRQ